MRNVKPTEMWSYLGSAVSVRSESTARKAPKYGIERGEKLQLLHRYDSGDFPMSVLRDYGVLSVRGPRSMPKSLVEDLNR